jgi:hypothetical protein
MFLLLTARRYENEHSCQHNDLLSQGGTVAQSLIEERGTSSILVRASVPENCNVLRCYILLWMEGNSCHV